MIEYFDSHLYAAWFTAGFVLLAIELLVLGFATGFVLFLGLAALLTGGLLWAGAIPSTGVAGIITFGFSSLFISALLWKPFKALQNKKAIPEKDNSSDIIGHEFRLEQDISITLPGKVMYSGIQWQVILHKSTDVQTIPSGSLVSVASVDAGKFYVVPVKMN